MSEQLPCVLNTQQHLARVCRSYSCSPGCPSALRALPRCPSSPFESIWNEPVPARTTLAVKKKKKKQGNGGHLLSPRVVQSEAVPARRRPLRPARPAQPPGSPRRPLERLHLHGAPHASLLPPHVPPPSPTLSLRDSDSPQGNPPGGLHSPPSRLQLSPSTPLHSARPRPTLCARKKKEKGLHLTAAGSI